MIETRLGELEREKAELTEYEELDRQRRALDYSLYEKQYNTVNMSNIFFFNLLFLC